MSNVKIVTFVPRKNADSVREAFGRAGAGTIGEYTYCSYSVVGQGRFVPSARATPHIGRPGVSETVEEERVEVVCSREHAKAAIAAVKSVHPYEEVALDIIPLLDEADL